MKFKLLKSTLLAVMLAASSNAWSAGNGQAGSGPNPFSDCGIGAALFPTVSWAAVTSNVIWDIGTTALTSATSSPETCSGKNLAAAIFINDTYESLAEETAKGQGEHLTTLLNILECGDANHNSIVSNMRAGVSEYVGTKAYDAKTYVEKASSFYDVVSSATTNQCSA